MKNPVQIELTNEGMLVKPLHNLRVPFFFTYLFCIVHLIKDADMPLITFLYYRIDKQNIGTSLYRCYTIIS